MFDSKSLGDQAGLMKLPSQRLALVDRRLVGVEQVGVGELARARQRTPRASRPRSRRRGRGAARTRRGRARAPRSWRRRCPAAALERRTLTRGSSSTCAASSSRTSGSDGGVVGHAQLPIGAGLTQHRGDRAVEEHRDRGRGPGAGSRSGGSGPGGAGDPQAARPAGPSRSESGERAGGDPGCGPARHGSIQTPRPAAARRRRLERQLQPQLAAGCGQLEAQRRRPSPRRRSSALANRPSGRRRSRPRP